MIKNIYKSQRIGVFVDIQNLYYSAKNLYQQKVNFEAILKEVTKGRSVVRAVAYVVKAEALKEQTFFDALKYIGFEIQSKDLQVFFGGAKKGDWDVGIAVDMIEMAPKLDAVILVSGDGDFVPLVHHLRHAFGVKVEASSFGRSSSSMLKEAVDNFYDLDKSSSKFLIKEKPIKKKATKTGIRPMAVEIKTMPLEKTTQEKTKPTRKKAVKKKSAEEVWY